jgi:hypothetical protein
MKLVRRHPKSAATVMTGVTLVAGAAIVVLADFGAPWWAFGCLLLWPATVGLPSSLAVVLVATLWGRLPGAYGLGGFVVVSALLAWLLQWAAVNRWNRFRS